MSMFVMTLTYKCCVWLYRLFTTNGVKETSDHTVVTHLQSDSPSISFMCRLAKSASQVFTVIFAVFTGLSHFYVTGVTIRKSDMIMLPLLIKSLIQDMYT